MTHLAAGAGLGLTVKVQLRGGIGQDLGPAVDLVADLLDPAGDRALCDRLAHLGHGHVNAHHASLNQAGAESSKELQRVVEDKEEVQRMLEDLPPSEAEIVRQFHLEGKSYREISSQLGIPENSIGPMLSRARLKMRQGNVPS